MADTTNTRHIVTVEVVGDAELKKFQQQAENLNTRLRAINGQSLKGMNDALSSTAKTSGRFGQSLQNAGYQINDFTAQVTSGTDATRAMALQLPALLQGFGGWGVAISVAVGVLSALAPALLGAKEGMDKFNTSVDDYTTAVNNFASANDQFEQDLKNLKDNVNETTVAFFQLSRIQALRAQDNIAEQARQLNKDLAQQSERVNELTAKYDDNRRALEAAQQIFERGFADNSVQIAAAQQQLARTGEEIQKTYGITAETLGDISSKFTTINEQLSTGKIDEAFISTVTQLQQMVTGSEALESTFGDLLDRVIVLGRSMITNASELERYDEILKSSEGTAGLINEHFEGQAATMGETAGRAGELETNLRNAVSEAKVFTTELRNALGVIQALAGQTLTLDLDTAGIEAQNAALKAGNDLVDARVAGLKAQRAAQLEVDLKSEDPVIAAFARFELEEYNKALDVNTAAKRENQALTDAYNQSLKSTAEASSAAAAAAKEHNDELDKQKGKLKTFVESSRTEYQALDEKIKETEQLYKDFGDTLNATDQKYYNQGIAELKKQLKELDPSIQQATEILAIMEQSTSSLFDSLIDGSKSAGEAFSDFLDQMLQDIAKFLVNQAVQQFFQYLVGGMTGGFGSLTAAPVAATPSGFGVVPADAIAAPRSALLPSAETVMRVVRQPRYVNDIPTLTSSGGSDQQPVNVIVNNNTNSQVSVAEGTSEDGSRQIDIYIENRVKTLMGSGQMDSTMRANYGLRRRG